MINSIRFFVFIILVLVSCSFNPTRKQEEFAASLLEKPNIQHVEWQTTLSLWVKVDRQTLGINPKIQAQSLAEDIAAAGLRYTQEPICVNIYYDNTSAIGSACQSY